MTAREIVRHPEILDGRWHFESTSIAVADVVRDYKASDTKLAGSYRFAGLSDQEVQVALLFAFPAVRGSGSVSSTARFGSIASAASTPRKPASGR